MNDMKRIADGLRKTLLANQLLDIVYSELQKGTLSNTTQEKIFLFYRDYDKYIDVVERENRKQAGCKYYTDSKGRVRVIATGKLDK